MVEDVEDIRADPGVAAAAAADRFTVTLQQSGRRGRRQKAAAGEEGQDADEAPGGYDSVPSGVLGWEDKLRWDPRGYPTKPLAQKQ